MNAAMETLLQDMKKEHRRVTSDSGLEFSKHKVATLLKTRSIHHYMAPKGEKRTLGLMERYNRTLRDLLGRNFQRREKLHWVEDLPGLVDNYNHSVHRTLGTTPHNVWHDKVTRAARPPRREAFPFHDGDRVRLWDQKDILGKHAGTMNWSTRTYTVARREGSRYVVKNEKGEELKTRHRLAHLQRVVEDTTSVQAPDSRVHPEGNTVEKELQNVRRK